MDIGVVGCGFVGTAVYEGLKNHHNLNNYDKNLVMLNNNNDNNFIEI